MSYLPQRSLLSNPSTHWDSRAARAEGEAVPQGGALKEPSVQARGIGSVGQWPDEVKMRPHGASVHAAPTSPRGGGLNFDRPRVKPNSSHFEAAPAMETSCPTCCGAVSTSGEGCQRQQHGGENEGLCEFAAADVVAGIIDEATALALVVRVAAFNAVLLAWGWNQGRCRSGCRRRDGIPGSAVALDALTPVTRDPSHLVYCS